jgi:hypothetical protein
MRLASATERLHQASPSRKCRGTSPRLLRTPSIHPKQSSSSTASGHVMPGFAGADLLEADPKFLISWCSSSQACQSENTWVSSFLCSIIPLLSSPPVCHAERSRGTCFRRKSNSLPVVPLTANRRSFDSGAGLASESALSAQDDRLKLILLREAHRSSPDCSGILWSSRLRRRFPRPSRWIP